jgi:hypothetical protein
MSRLLPRSRKLVVLPDWRLGTPEEAARIEAHREQLRMSGFYLIRIAGNGEVMRCRRCDAKHTHMTLMCIERPFQGIRDPLMAYYQHFGAEGAIESFTEPELKRYRAIQQYLGKTFENIPDYASAHPLSARALDTAEEEIDIGAITLGVLDPIDAPKAYRLANRINGRGLKPPLVFAPGG